MLALTNPHILSDIHSLTSPYSWDQEFNEIIAILLYSLWDIWTKAILSYTLSQWWWVKEKLQHYLNDNIVSQKWYLPTTIYAFISNPEFGSLENNIISHRNFYNLIKKYRSLKITFLKLILHSVSKNPNNSCVVELSDPKMWAKISINKDDMKFYIGEILWSEILIEEICTIADLDIQKSTHTLSTLIRVYGFDNFDILSSKIDFSIFTIEFIFLIIDELFQFLIHSKHNIIKSLLEKSDANTKLLDKLNSCENKSDYKVFFQLICEYASTIKITILNKILKKLNNCITWWWENKKTALLDGYNLFQQYNTKPQILIYDANTKRFKRLSSRKSNTLY